LRVRSVVGSRRFGAAKPLGDAATSTHGGRVVVVRLRVKTTLVLAITVPRVSGNGTIVVRQRVRATVVGGRAATVVIAGNG
jgi:hypothetical protein